MLRRLVVCWMDAQAWMDVQGAGCLLDGCSSWEPCLALCVGNPCTGTAHFFGAAFWDPWPVFLQVSASDAMLGSMLQLLGLLDTQVRAQQWHKVQLTRVCVHGTQVQAQ